MSTNGKSTDAKSETAKSERSTDISMLSRIKSEKSEKSVKTVYQAKVKAEATMASLQIAENESDLKREKARLLEERTIFEASHTRRNADIETDLDLLTKTRKAAVAKLKHEAAMEESESLFSRSSRSNRSSHKPILQQTLPVIPSIDKTKRYVDQQNMLQTEVHAGETVYDFNNNNSEIIQPADTNNVATQNTELGELTRFLLKKDLLLNRFTRFNDQPEAYRAWKANFTSIAKELQLNAFEEQDMLLKYLGPDSYKFAHSIRLSNPESPPTAVLKIWERLENRYGCTEMVEASLKKKLSEFPNISYKNWSKLYELHDVLTEVLSAKQDSRYATLLNYFDTSAGVKPIVNKLPSVLQGKWRDKASRYKNAHDVSFPPFDFFVQFIADCAKTYNDPSFTMTPTPSQFHEDSVATGHRERKSVFHPVQKQTNTVNTYKCIVHNAANHSLNDCRAFRQKSFDMRRRILRTNRMCFRCCETAEHHSQDCKAKIVCAECNSTYHCTAMHIAPRSTLAINSHGGELETKNTNSQEPEVTVNYIDIDPVNYLKGKSCAKIVPVYLSNVASKTKRLKVYMMLNDQSNRTLARKQVFDKFDAPYSYTNFTLTSCSGSEQRSGRQATGFQIESLDQSIRMDLPVVIECDEIPDNRNEIATPDVTRLHRDLYDLADCIPPLDENADILLLVGRDVIDAHRVLEIKPVSPGSPIAHRLAFGWVIFGNLCDGNLHLTNTVQTCKTNISTTGRPSILSPCDSNLHITEHYDILKARQCKIGETVFNRTSNDNQVGLSYEDKLFLNVMDTEMNMDDEGYWNAPLPFKPDRKPMMNNRALALKRAQNLDKSLLNDKSKQEHFVDFTNKLLLNKHAEVAPPLTSKDNCWYLPVFGVYHPRKPTQKRCVFDSSAKYYNTSLNDQLLSGPDLNNSLIGVLMRFRKHQVGVCADIQQMFYSFMVNEEHRDFLRFLWHKDNDLEKELIDYRMRVHVFGNSPSPSVAIYGLHKSVESADPDVKSFVRDHFYVDDGLISTATSDEAVDLLKRTQKTLMDNGNLRLHKFISNSEKVMSALPQEDLAKDLKDLDLDADRLPIQRSLGIQWDLESDIFTFNISQDSKPFTRRDVLSTVNSIFDPLGFVAPVTIVGKSLLRKYTTDTVDWDEPIPVEFEPEWENWKLSLMSLQKANVPRMYIANGLSGQKRKELHIFADASEKAIAAVGYIRVVEDDGSSSLGFVLGKAKLAPLTGHTIPRLELCAAVLGVEISETIIDNNISEIFDEVRFYSDSKVTLGYINNETRRFYIYVENRVQRIRQSSTPEQWYYVPTSKNPADQATRSLSAEDISSSLWIWGPTEFLSSQMNEATPELHDLVNPNDDNEIRADTNISSLKTTVKKEPIVTYLEPRRFEDFSTWKSLIRGISVLIRVAR